MREEEPFISLLVQKLKRVKRDREVREKLEHALQQFREFRSRLSARKSHKKVHWDEKVEGKRTKLPQGNEEPRDQEDTVVGYCFGPNSVPFISRVRGKPMSTLADFKTLFNRKGCYRYFFKKYSNEFGTKIVFEEVTHDLETLPLWDGKVFAIVEEMENV